MYPARYSRTNQASFDPKVISLAVSRIDISPQQPIVTHTPTSQRVLRYVYLYDTFRVVVQCVETKAALRLTDMRTKVKKVLRELNEAELPPTDVILSVRSAKKLADLGRGLKSGIHKKPHQGKVKLCNTGIPGDSIDYPYHGGPDKALHQYCAAHYPRWRDEKPEIAHMFDIGLFGENISLERLNELNVCIGDIYRIGEDTLVQITEPRLPCFKINARLKWPAAARRLQKSDRYGWYMRILDEGSIEEGDKMMLEKRLNPRWNIKNCFHVCIDKEVDEKLVQELHDIEGLGKAIKDLTGAKLEGGGEDAFSRQNGGSFYYTPYELVEADMLSPRVRRMVFEYRGPDDPYITDDLPLHAYMNLKFAGFERAYSVVSGHKDRFVLGVALDDNTRGGSKYLHEELSVGNRVEVSRGENVETEAPPDFDPFKVEHIIIVGGIGVTAFLREIEGLMGKKIGIQVHYACRSMEEASFKDHLPDQITEYYPKDEGRRLDVTKLIPKPNGKKYSAKIYCCGPNRLNEAVEKQCEELGYPAYLQEIESFGAPHDGNMGEEFEVVVHDPETSPPKPETINVPSDKTLLDVLQDSGFDVPANCRAGRCGVCVVSIRDGREAVCHKGGALTEEMKTNHMLSCVSRAKDRIEIIIE